MGLAEKIRKSREERVEAGGHLFIVRRPTDLEMMTLRGNGSLDRMLPFVVGWENVREIDILPGGDPHPLAFDAEACAEWLSDRPDLLEVVVEKIMAAYRRHAGELKAAKKK